MSDLLRQLARSLIGGGPQPTMSRRDFLRGIGSTAAAAAASKVPAPAGSAGNSVRFVEDPRALAGFTGLRTDGAGGAKDPIVGNHAMFWMDDYPDAEAMDRKQLRLWIKQHLGVNPDAPGELPWSLREGVPSRHAMMEKAPYYEWNINTRRWHPVVALPRDDGGPLAVHRYLEPGSAIPNDAMGYDYWSRHLGYPFEAENQMFYGPGDLASALQDEWRSAQLWRYRKDGVNQEDIAKDPELRQKYSDHLVREGRSHGSNWRDQPQVQLENMGPRRSEFEPSLDMSVPVQEPRIDRNNFRRYLAPSLLAPAAVQTQEQR